MNKNILMICYYFPPLADVGCKRSVAFSEYLKKYGWEPHVLSVKNPDRAYCLVGKEQPPLGVQTSYALSLFNVYWFFGKINALLYCMFRIFGLTLKRNYLHDIFSIPDIFLGWIPGAILRGLRIIRKEKINYIYVSCSPFSSAFAGIALKKITGRPLIIDFRDPFYINVPDVFGVPLWRRKINCRLEKTIIKKTDIFIVNNEEVRKGYIRAYPEIDKKTYVIHNGFDHQLIKTNNFEKFDKFTIFYAGNMYFEAVKSEAFFEAILRLKEKKIINKDNFQFLYFGKDMQVIDKIARKFSIDDVVSNNSLVSHEKILENLFCSHLQLLRIIKPMISTKLFEGIAMNIPFLATIPRGEVEEIIRKFSPASYIISDDSSEKIGAAIIDAMEKYSRNNVKPNYVSEFLAEFSREKLTQKLINIIEAY